MMQRVFPLLLVFLLVSCAALPAHGGESLHLAAAQGDLAVMKRMLGENPNALSSRDQEFGGTPLHWAVAADQRQAAQWLLQEGAEANLRNGDGRSALHLAAALGLSNLVELLIAHDALLNMRDRDDNTPLHLAAALGRQQTVEQLLRSGADVSLLNRANRTPRQWAELQQQAGAAALLLEAEEAQGRSGKVPTGTQPGEERLNTRDGAIMVWVPAGRYTMGRALTEGREDEYPPHPVYLDGYWIYKYEVTVTQFHDYCSRTGQPLPPVALFGWGDEERPVNATPDDPIVGLTWAEAQAYAQWAGGALPTEAQWEKAACGPEGLSYPWGFTWDPAKCNNAEIRQQEKTHFGTTPVGSFPDDRSPYGVMDMAGNAWEWCADWYDADYYGDSPDRNPTGPTHGVERSIRGGCWLVGIDGDFPTSTQRAALRPDNRRHFGGGGLRCVILPRE